MKESTGSRGRNTVYVLGHAGANSSGYILKSRYVMEQKLGRLLEPHEQVHHINGDKTDDSPENLKLTDIKEHSKIHAKKRRKLDYDKITELRKQGLGYKKITKLLGYPLGSVKAAVRVIDKEMGAKGLACLDRAENAMSGQ